MKLITQEAPMGCAIACAASLAGISYKKMKNYFNDADSRERICGFFNRDIILALSRVNLIAKAYSVRRWNSRSFKMGAIVFIGRSKKYPAGHYLLKTKKGWMNPWLNYPNINPAKAGFQKKILDEIKWIIEPR